MLATPLLLKSQNFTKILNHNDSITTDSAGNLLAILNINIVHTADFFNRFTVEIDSNDLDTLSKISWITGLNDPQIPQLFNYESRLNSNAINVQAQPWGNVNPFNLSGAGVNVGVWDSGLPYHTDLDDHTTVMENSPCVPVNFTHSLHCCGTLAGKGVVNSQYSGVAPGCNLFTWSMFSQDPNNCSGPPYIPDEMLLAVDNQGINIASNSYGYPYCSSIGIYSNGTYGTDFDKLVRDKNLNLFFAAGNQRYDINCNLNYFTVCAPSVAKNVISVGAVDNNNNIWISYYNGVPYEGSSIGPVKDGRLKPDLVAVGVDVTSCGLNNTYLTSQGTSCACPAVAGVGALLTEKYKILNNNALPKPALLKAIMLNTANDLGNPGPDYIYGHGLINAIDAVNTIDRNYYETSTVSTNQTYTKQIQVDHPCAFKVTLVWSDKEGFTTYCVQDLINDLDIQLIDPNNGIHYPWTLDPLNPSANAIQSTANHKDNVEQVLVSAPISGLWTIQVSGYNIPYGPQDFSIVWSEPTVPTAASNNSPVNIGDPLYVLSPMGGSSYNWSGPNSFTSTNQNLSFTNAQSQNAGTYTVTVTYNGNCTFTSSTVVTINPNLTGWVRYHGQELNTNHPVNNTIINLFNGTTNSYSVQTNTQGNYQVSGNPNTYDVELDIQNPFSIPNSTDALLIAKHYVNQISLTPFQQMIANVNGDLNINATDALLTMRRFLGTISSFAGNDGQDWYYEQYSGSQSPITIQNNQTYTSNYSAACMGDVDLNNYLNYNYPKKEPQIILHNRGDLHVKAGLPVNVDVIILDSMVVGAMSLIFTIPSTKYKVNYVKLPETCDSCQIFNTDKERLSIAWYNIDGVLKKSNEVLLSLNLTAEDPNNETLEDIMIIGSSEIIDTTLHLNANIELVIPKIVVDPDPLRQFTLELNPNPTNSELHLTYTLPDKGNIEFTIYDIFGRKVTTFINTMKNNGLHRDLIDVSQSEPGTYTYKFIFNGEVKTGKLIIVK